MESLNQNYIVETLRNQGVPEDVIQTRLMKWQMSQATGGAYDPIVDDYQGQSSNEPSEPLNIVGEGVVRELMNMGLSDEEITKRLERAKNPKSNLYYDIMTDEFFSQAPLPSLPSESEENWDRAKMEETDHQREEDLKFLERFELDPTITDEPIQFGFKIGDTKCFPKGDVQAVKGLAKSAKTMLDVILMAAALRGSYMGIECLIKSPKVLFCDTEQHPRNVRLAYRRVCLLAGINGHERHENLNMQHLRLATDVEEMKKAIFLKIKNFRPDFCFVDGVADLVNDFNDLKESKAIITELSKVALEYNCTLILTLHTNPGENAKMRGHEGTILAQKASDVVSCRKEKREDGMTIFCVEQTENRNGADFAPFQFAIEVRQDMQGEYLAVPVRTYVSSQEKETLDNLFKWALKEPMRRGDLKDRIMSDESPVKCKKSMAYQHISNAIAAGIVKDDDPVCHFLRYVGLNQHEDDRPF